MSPAEPTERAHGSPHAPTRTKIVATLGPASRQLEQIRGLVRAGADVFRVNFSHGSAEENVETLRAIREAGELEHAPIAILADLQGPKIRVGALRNGEPLTLREDDALVIVAGEEFEGEPGRVACTYAALAEDVRPGERILIDDGQIELKVVSVDGNEVHARVVYGGSLRPHKGVNLPGTVVQAPSLTPKDEADLEVALDEGVDYLALSFVRRPDDVLDLQRRVADHPMRPEIIAKIERPEAVEHMVEIVDAADGIMVARGDMGVELGPEQVPPIQKELIRRCVDAAKPVITATQMLESMIERPRPTRAEASDVANAIYDGTSAVMLSAETAIGRDPLLTVQTMDRIARRTEAAIFAEPSGHRMRETGPSEGTASTSEATVRSAAYAAMLTEAKGIVVFTESGRTARLLARERLPMHLFAFTPDPRTLRRLNLQWGIIPLMGIRADRVDELRQSAARTLRDLGFVEPGDCLVYIAGEFNVSGATNTIHIETLGAAEDPKP